MGEHKPLEYVPDEALNAESEAPEDATPQENPQGVSRRKFLRTLVGAAAAAATPEFLQAQAKEEKPAPQTTEAKREQELKELYIQSARKRFERIQKVTDLESKRSELNELRRSMAINRVTLDDLGIETKQQKRVRTVRRLLTLMITSKSDQTRQPLKDIIAAKMSEEGITYQNLELEKDDEDVVRLLPLKEQLEHTIWLGGSDQEKRLQTFLSTSFSSDRDAEQYLEYYYRYKTLDPFRVTQYADASKNKIMSDWNDQLLLGGAFRGIEFKRYNVDPARDVELYQYLTKLEQATQAKVKHELEKK